MNIYAILTLYIETLLESIPVSSAVRKKDSDLSKEISDALREPASDTFTPSAALFISHIPRMGSLLARLPWSQSCLTKAVTIRRVLKRRGVTPSIKIGANGEAGQVQIHAWIEIDGRRFLRGKIDYTEFSVPSSSGPKT